MIVIPTYPEFMGAATLAMEGGDHAVARELGRAMGHLRAGSAPKVAPALAKATERGDKYLTAARERWSWIAADPKEIAALTGKVSGRFKDQIQTELSRLATTLMHLPGPMEYKGTLSQAMLRVQDLVTNDERRSTFFGAMCASLAGEGMAEKGLIDRVAWRNCRDWAAQLGQYLVQLANAADRISPGQGEITRSIAAQLGTISKAHRFGGEQPSSKQRRDGLLMLLSLVAGGLIAAAAFGG